MLKHLKHPIAKRWVPVGGTLLSAFLLGPLHLVTLGCAGAVVALHFLVK